MRRIRNKTNLISIAITILTIQILGYFSINYFGDYGWTVFILIPIIIGFLPNYISGRKLELTKNDAYNLGFITAVIASLILLLFAIEGLICIIMASPLITLGVWLGAYVGHIITKKNKLPPKNITAIIIFLSLSFMSFDYVNESSDLIPVRTKIIVNAPVEKVWTNVVTFDTIAPPTDWIFKTGISYPTDATIKGTGVGAIRYCNFTTGSFIEPITTWKEPNLLQFNVKEQPIPMNELNPFWEVHPPHLDGYFKSYKGQFKLTKINEKQTELEGTTWYKVDLYPVYYWKTWSNFIIHRIHKRVLNHIKSESE